MKRLFKKNESKNATNYKTTRAFAMESEIKETGLDNLMYQRVGKSRQEIFDLMKILKTF
jgi:hypothetical protein